MISIILFFVGFLLLIKGADFLVEGASSIAKKFKIAPIVIGLTVVSFGTSAPEFFINIISSYSGNTEIAVGNILGSNIANVLLILGVSALVYPLISRHNTVWKEIPFSFLAIFILTIMANDRHIDGESFAVISRIDGIVLIAFFVIFLYYTFSISKAEGEEFVFFQQPSLSVKKSILYILFGVLGLFVGGKFIVDGAVLIAKWFDISSSFIGLTVIAVGTSLPELATSVVASLKKNSDIAIGNVVGSNIFNIFLIIGVSAILNPLPILESSNLDLYTAIFSSFMLFAFMFIGKKHTLEKYQGGLLVFIYVLYITTIVFIK
jgi:cation:H+ antiporter